MIRDSMNRYGATARAGVALLALLVLPALAAGQGIADKYRMARERQSAFTGPSRMHIRECTYSSKIPSPIDGTIA